MLEPGFFAALAHRSLIMASISPLPTEFLHRSAADHPPLSPRWSQTFLSGQILITRISDPFCTTRPTPSAPQTSLYAAEASSRNGSAPETTFATCADGSDIRLANSPRARSALQALPPDIASTGSLADMTWCAIVSSRRARAGSRLPPEDTLAISRSSAGAERGARPQLLGFSIAGESNTQGSVLHPGIISPRPGARVSLRRDISEPVPQCGPASFASRRLA